MRISDWSSDVCSSDLMPEHGTLSPKKLGGTPVVIHLTVPDVDAFVDKAVTAGAELKMPPQDMFWGDRYGQVEDPFGHLWSIATPLRATMREDELKAAAQDAMCGAQIGRASWRDSGCQYEGISVVGVS